MIGFTGTQEGLTALQLHSLRNILFKSDDDNFIHGGCIGGDEQAHYTAYGLAYNIYVRPGVTSNGEPKKRGTFIGAHKIYPEKFYLDRNKDIVDDCDVLIACPKGKEELRSGTWSTVRYARSQDKSVIIIWPTGLMERS